MRKSISVLVAAGLVLAACGKAGAPGGGPAAGAPALKLGPKDGAWSEHEALEGPMAVWGPAELGKEVLSVTCLPAPRRTLVATLFAPALPSGKPATGELTLRADGQVTTAPLSPKEGGAAEARIAVDEALLKRLEQAKDLRFEVKSNPGDGADTGAPTEALKRVIAACH